MALDYILPSALRTAATVSSNNIVIAADRAIRADLLVTASTAPTTLDVKVEHSNDGGTTFTTLAAFTQVGAVGAAGQSIHIPGPHAEIVRVTYTLVGTNYTFSVALRS